MVFKKDLSKISFSKKQVKRYFKTKKKSPYARARGRGGTPGRESKKITLYGVGILYNMFDTK